MPAGPYPHSYTAVACWQSVFACVLVLGRSSVEEAEVSSAPVAPCQQWSLTFQSQHRMLCEPRGLVKDICVECARLTPS